MSAPPTPGRTWRPWAAAAALFCLSLAFRLAILHRTHYDGLYGLDAYAYFDYAAELRKALLSGHLPPPFFWPLGYPMLCFAFSLFTGPTALAGQAASLASGSLCPVLVFWMVLQCRRQAIAGALIAGVAMSTGFYAASLSLSYMSDMPGLMWALLAVNAMLAYCGPGLAASAEDMTLAVAATSGTAAPGLPKRWLALAAVALAFALLTRWGYALLAAPLGLAALAAYAQRRTSLGDVARHAALAVAAGGAVLALHFAPTLYHADAAVGYAGDLQVYTWSPWNYFRTAFDTNDGHSVWKQPPSVFYLWPLRDWRYIAPVFTPLLLLGLWSLIRRGPRPAAVLLCAWALGFYLFFAGVYMQNNRFPLSYFPPLLAAFALGFEVFAGAIARGRLVPAMTLAAAAWVAWQAGLSSGLLIAALLPLAWCVWRPVDARWALACTVTVCMAPAFRQTILDLEWTQTRVVPAELAVAKWAGAQIPPDAVLLAQGNSEVLSHNISQRVIDLFNLTDEERTALFSQGHQAFVLVDPIAVEKQWAGARPMNHLTWLRMNTTLTEIGTNDRYHLYRAQVR